MPRAAPRIHVVDDDTEIRLLLGAWLASAGYAVDGFGSGQAYLDYGGPPPALVCLDLNMPNPDGLTVLRTLRGRGVPCSIVVFTAEDAVNTAVECMKLGAFDFVVKPIHKAGFLRVVEAAVRPAVVAVTGDRTRAEAPSFIGDSAVMDTVRCEIGKVADTDITVFIHGESGCSSMRLPSSPPLPKFGSFVSRRERTVEPVGASEPMPINVRVLSATHRDLEEMITSHGLRRET